MTNLPTGTVTFLFTDIEGSTKLAQGHPDKWESLQQRHHAILQSAIDAHSGFVFQIIGDAFCAAFHTAKDGFNAAIEAQRNLQTENWDETPVKVRMGIHTGLAELRGNEYRGYMTMARVQRVMSVAYGGQILLSNASAELIHNDLTNSIALRDMKEHRLKGLLDPERLWQVIAPDLRQDFPPLQSLKEIPNNLPAQLTSFVGREKEMVEVKRLLGQNRLVTLTGSGGTGKTRLSLQVAAELLDSFPAGVWFIELAPITDPALVPYILGNLLGLRESAESKQTIAELVAMYFHSRKALVIFDNCEHLIESCAHFADLLLRSCKDLRILASSREALGVEGEMAWRVPSLLLPDLKQLPAIEQLSQYEAVRLFVERATLVQPHFAVTKDNAPAIAQICFRLDGIPLAIELAAARSNVLTLDQIAKRLDDRFRLLTGGARTALPRQQTLRALIDWSYNLLSEEERLLFTRLAVFVGGWTLEGAEAVCSGDGLESHQILDLLSQLVKKSLVVMTEENGESRYHRLETIRQYAREKLFETDEAAHIRDRHLDYFIQLAEQGYEELQGPNDLIWIEKLEMEHDNFRTALSWSLESPEADPQRALQLSGALQDFWDTFGYTTEGYQWLSNALNKAPEAPTSYHCRALIGIGVLSTRLSRFNDAILYIDNALNLARQLKIAPMIISSLFELSDLAEDNVKGKHLAEECLALARVTRNLYYLAAVLAYWAGAYSDNMPETIRYIEEARLIAEKLGNARIRISVLRIYGVIQRDRANHDLAIPLFQEALHLSQLLKDKHSTALCLLALGRTATEQTRYDDAIRYNEQALQILRDLSDHGCSARSLLFLGWNACLAGNYSQAIEHLEESLSIYRDKSDMKVAPALPMLVLGQIAISQGNIQKAKRAFLESLELLKLEEWIYWLPHCLEGVCALPGIRSERAARLLGKAEAIRERAGGFSASERLLVDPILDKLQSQLGKEAFDSAHTTGATLTYQQAIDEAMEVLQFIE